MSKELRIVNGWFLDKHNDGKPQCAFMADRACTPDCAACEIDDSRMVKTVTCLRGSFVFANIVEE
jgi:hypothetical protein